MKPWLTGREAADYCCVCVKQFRGRIASTTLAQPYRMWGKKVYRRLELDSMIEHEVTLWQPSSSVETPTLCSGRSIQPPANESSFASPLETSRESARRRR